MRHHFVLKHLTLHYKLRCYKPLQPSQAHPYLTDLHEHVRITLRGKWKKFLLGINSFCHSKNR